MRFPIFSRFRRRRDLQSAAAELMRSGRHDEADRVLAEGLATFPKHKGLMVDYAMSAHESGRYTLAAERWEAALRVAPCKPICYAGLAANLRELGELSRACASIDQALKRFPRNVGVVTEAARVAAAEGRFAEAAALWRKAAERRRPHPDWSQGFAQCLALLGRFDDARQILAKARKRHPDHRGLLGVEGLLAVAREDWTDAVERWRAYRRRFPDDPTGWEQLGNALQGQALELAEVPAPAATAAPVPAVMEIVDDERIRRLLLRFESLGDNCELGLVQRRYGAEPLGLLRWNTVVYEQLLKALAHRFEGMGDVAHTEIALATNGEYFVQDRRWHLGMHTFVHAGQTNPDVLLGRMCRRVVFLRDKLVADLSAADKIFVYRSGGLGEERLAALHAALRAYGPITLLAVQPAEPINVSSIDQRPGEVIEIAPRCFIGFLSRLGITAGQTTWDIAFDEWLLVCRKVAEFTDHIRVDDDRLAS